MFPLTSKTAVWFSFTLTSLLTLANVFCENFDFIDLPDAHVPYYFHNFPDIAGQCETAKSSCPYQRLLQKPAADKRPNQVCWGYEADCNRNNSFSSPRCPGTQIGWTETKGAHVDIFYEQADFGYIRNQLNEMKIICEPLFPKDAVLQCTKYLRFCRGRNLMMNFTDLIHRKEPLRYKMDIFKPGQIGGHCTFYKDRLDSELDHLSALQSWAPELRFFESYAKLPIENDQCDVIVDKPTFLMKLDATSNMYHHFCDFFNLYASLHANASHPTAFGIDVNILIWETYNYSTPFSETFKAFTSNPILTLKAYEGKRVCFKNLVFSLLPRMIFGLYYNTPIVSGCENSGLFHAFAEHVLHRLAIPEHPKTNDRIRITLLSRRTKYRQILNVDELVDEISNNDTYIVRHVSFDRNMPFRDQLEMTRNTDIFIGMHGAGLTHLLFLPKWATVFELYNCEDPNCYRDLARLHGVNYVTWERSDKLIQQDAGQHPDGGSHAKFTNYAFDAKEFGRLVNNAAQYVWDHPEYKNYIAKYYASEHDEL